MSVTPSDTTLAQGVLFEQQPSRTWYIDQESLRIRGECTDYAAVRQAVEVILNVERFRWQIYQPWSGMQWEGLLGQDAGYVAAEVQRRVREALGMDDRVRGISQFTYSVEGDVLKASFVVNTVYGDVDESVEVSV